MAQPKTRKGPRKLSPRYQAFVAYYIECWNATEAARKAGMKGKFLHTHASKLLQKATIRAEIDRKLKEMSMGAEEVLARLTQHGRGSLAPFIGDDGRVDLLSDDAKAQLHLVKKAKVKERILYVGQEPVKEIETEIEIHDAQAALVHLGKHHRLFGEVASLSLDVSKLSDDQLARIANGEDPLQVLASASAGRARVPQKGPARQGVGDGSTGFRDPQADL